ncbi:MAG TPA: class I SAM-dependent methyltransferase [Pseudonocardiaceae bacterium]|jgi:ubiquinone/menaquinone biosynthesis C-methylase UbiE
MGLSARDVFDSLGKDHETAFAGFTAQRDEAEWLAGELPANARVLDVGCGTGKPVAEVLAAAGHRVTGYDVSPTMVELARAQLPQVSFEVGDLRTLEQPASSWDAVVACYSLLQLTRAQIDAALAKFADWLAPGGIFLLVTVPVDVEGFDFEFMGKPVTVSSYSAEGYRERLDRLGLAVVRERFAEFQPDFPGAAPEPALFLSARKS